MASPPQNISRVSDKPVGHFKSGLATAIANSTWMLELPEGWGDDKSNKPVTPQTFQLAVEFLLSAANVYGILGADLPAPTISPGPNRSIDLHWKSDTVELLANVRPYPEASASFYLELLNGFSVKGEIDLKNLQGSSL